MVGVRNAVKSSPQIRQFRTPPKWYGCETINFGVVASTMIRTPPKWYGYETR